MRYRNTLPAIAIAFAATATLTGCELQQGQPHHITVTELEAPWVDVTPPTELWIELITEGDFKERCATTFGGTFSSDSNGRLCIVTNP